MHTISAAKVQKYLQICKYLCFFSAFSVVLCLRRHEVAKKCRKTLFFLDFACVCRKIDIPLQSRENIKVIAT
jgi:hypothetical protein